MNLIERYIKAGRIRVLDDGLCWLWTGALTGKGYGSLSGGRYAHRVSYETYKGPVPDGMQVLHRCDVKRCVNPDHLYAGTHADNVRDAMDRDRYGPKEVLTHCHRGHEFTEENTYLYQGHRHCKECWKLRYKNNGQPGTP